MLAFPCVWEMQELEVLFQCGPSWHALFQCKQEMEECNWPCPLQYAMHVIMAELLAWLQDVLGQQIWVQHHGLAAECPSCGLLPHLEILLGGGLLLHGQLGIRLEHLVICGQYELVVLLDVAMLVLFSGAGGPDVGAKKKIWFHCHLWSPMLAFGLLHQPTKWKT